MGATWIAWIAVVVALLNVRQEAQGAKTLADQNMPDSPLECSCSDVDPRSAFYKADVQFPCYEQATFVGPDGPVCELQYMKDTPEELPEGYCQISCGRCPCCKSLNAVLLDRNLTGFAWLLNLTWEYGPQAVTSRPGFMVTVLAPDNKAVDAALRGFGYASRAAAEADPVNLYKLRNTALLHVLPPVPVTLATWTAPFFLTGQQIPTALNDTTGAPIKVTTLRNPDGGVRVLAPGNSSAWVVEQDIWACKSVVQRIDTVLLPNVTGW